MNLKLIEAETKQPSRFLASWYTVGDEKYSCPSIALPIIAAFFPKQIQISIVDEKIDSLDLNEHADLVAISFKSLAYARAYELADYYRSKNIKVILGGVHATLLPEEAAQHADSVVVGEAEGLLPQLINDLEKGELKKIYRSDSLIDLSNAPVPKFELINNKKYLCHAIQTSRGCSLNCEFCPTREMYRGTFRVKPIENVLSEVSAALAIEKKGIFFTDGIFGAGNREYVLALLNKLRKLKIDFMVISDYKVLNKELILALAKSGCRKLCINMMGACTGEEIKAIKSIKSLGIEVWGYFMFGLKFHKKDVFERVVDFIDEAGLAEVSFSIMSPYPNTPMGKRFEEAKKIISRDWSLYDQNHVVYNPELMSVKELSEGYDWIWEKKGSLTRVKPYYHQTKEEKK